MLESFEVVGSDGLVSSTKAAASGFLQKPDKPITCPLTFLPLFHKHGENVYEGTRSYSHMQRLAQVAKNKYSTYHLFI